MSVTDADVLAEIQWRLIEDATFSAGLWTLGEVAALVQQRQDRFNRETFLLLAHEFLAAVAGTPGYDLPDDWIATQRVSWKSTVTGVYTPLSRIDRFGRRSFLLGTNAPTKPIGYDDTSAGPRRVEVSPTPQTDGQLHVLYASTLELLNFNPIAPDILDLPDDFVPYVVYGTLADLLSKEGEGRDLARAAYCNARFDEGVAIAAFFLGGFA
jgi:hypothetical protein